MKNVLLPGLSRYLTHGVQRFWWVRVSRSHYWIVATGFAQEIRRDPDLRACLTGCSTFSKS